MAEKGAVGVIITPAHVVEVRHPLANDEAAHKGCHSKVRASWITACDREVRQDVVVEYVLGELGAGVPVEGVTGDVHFLMILQLGVADYPAEIRALCSID